MWLSAETNTILLTALIGLFVTGAGTIGAWLRVWTKKFNEQAEENKALIKTTKEIQAQTDGLTKKMQAISAVVGFTKGRVQGREEGESKEPYEELTKLEDEISRIMKTDYNAKKPKP